jgi:hypothetical protein
MVSLSKSISDPQKEGLQISWCERTNKERFYMLHWPLGNNPKNGSMDSSANELDIVLDKLCNSNFDLSIL